MTRLLVVSRACLNRYSQVKFEYIKQNMKVNEDFIIIVPDRVFTRFRGKITLLPNDYLKDNFVQIKSYLNKMSLFLNPLFFSMKIYNYRSSITYIEEDPHSLIGFQSVIFTKIFNPKSKIIFFIWDNLNRRPRFPLNILKFCLTKISLYYADFVVTGNSRANYLLHKEKNFKKKSIVLPQVGVDTYTYQDKKHYFKKYKGFTYIGYAGRMVEEKGLHTIIRALEFISNSKIKLVLIGNGPLIQSHIKKWNKVLKGNIIFIDTVPQSEIYKVLCKIDIFILASISKPFWIEQFGHILAQAMAAGCACIGSNSGAIPEVLNNEELIFPEGDHYLLAKILKRLIIDKEFKKNCIKKSKRYARKNYSHNVIAKKYLDLFRKL